MDSGSRRRGGFSPAARAAAAEARRRRTLARGPVDELRVFVVRDERLHHGFRWEIRRYGGFVVDMSAEVFDSQRQARRFGEKMLRTSVRADQVSRSDGHPDQSPRQMPPDAAIS
jgi:hypothetical protein